MKIEKWQALGNDYLILEQESLPWDLSGARIRRLCDPHFGLGADGICLVSAGEGDAVARVAIFNPDGSRAEISGNGVREAALYLHSHGRTGGDTFTIETDAGTVSPEVLSGGLARVDMGRASTASDSYPTGDVSGRGEIDVGGLRWGFQFVSIGNPQCAIEVESGLDELDLAALGPGIEGADLFPNRTNVSFWTRVSDHETGSRIRARIFERGVGETLSSGTGASGAAVAAVLGGVRSPVEVELDGGTLTVEVGEDLGITLTGWASMVYSAEISEALLSELEEETEPPRLTGTS